MKFFQTKGYKVVSGFIYGWGASCVIIGALFKIMHFPGAGIVLTVGMLVEAAIFFFSAFEPQMEHYDWTRVFPQLGKKKIAAPQEEIALSGMVDMQPSQPVNALKGLDQKDIDDLKRGIRTIADSADSFASIAVNAPEVAKKIDGMANTFDRLDNNARQVGDALENSVQTLACGYTEINRLMTTSTRELSERIRENSSKMFEGMVQSGEQFAGLGRVVEEQTRRIRTDADAYSQQMNTTAQNIAALNALYEIQIKETKNSMEVFRKVQGETTEILKHVAESRESACRFKQETHELAVKVTSLNDVYGNMLSLVNNN